ncbi:MULTISPECIES: SDR family oxidoreductase [Sphingopyxis]|jgi:NAD(P)-dependent dehydrogenase (short-subunit alcohol dehydrogenase family)|uniref:NAD(P)-dependent dehydrogenase, short-chain alcohol dehydrogenase family n=1 Tax=Sphingopyxis terrae subsp. ummariensis TaxID=429001 RepID=A0A1Y6FTV2_9SPHN|nr:MULTISPECIES: SDR family NAD(P)-dependent oxidoreductase [Sphingopyxis]KTE75005.1 short-chain dehydrogenase [Sphingopyxis sp. A083]MBU7588355.1 SDR family oxidoreductase [Sphingopyxis terrae]MDX8357290.1 SDR family oxidoreductase [Sphingopyxis terrae]PCF91694.1 short-chain dehydrogenase [Sphingopyxis terrae subsp. ummariensis]SMQ76931.1 NAD(P)-dependent dehydrogenase, short-chain alcohol dehydrogenase family [Sphingopyxis terrae subsp. ummariensis]
MASEPKFDLSGRVALVTGASSGLGAGFAKALAAAGAKVVLAARRADKLAEQVEAIRAAGGEAVAVSMDVTDEASTKAAYDAAEAAFGTVDTIVANAGVATEKVALGLSVEDVDFLLAANVRGVFLTATEGARRLEAAGSRDKENGRIVIIGSITAEKIFPATSVYGATKAAVRHMGKALAREWARRGISVNVIQPGYFESEMTAELFASEAGAKFVASFPRQRLRPPSDLHTPLLMLCSDAARGITGSVITIDDGQTL